jgi:signal peptidase I
LGASVHNLTVSLSDDVKDVLSQAKRLTRKPPNDLDVAIALLRQNRLYSKLDTLLKSLGIAPRVLEKALVHYRQQIWRPNGNDVVHIDSGATELAKEIAENEARSLQLRTARVQVDHLLRALTRSQAVGPVFNQFHLTEDAVDKAVEHHRTRAVRHGVFYFAREVLEIVVVVMFFLVAIKEGIGELRLIPSESMVPTLQIDDRILIEKITKWWRPYQRGDILVFYPPDTILHQDPLSLFMRASGFSSFIFKKDDKIDVAYIKRLIGLPGDTVDVRPGAGVYVNGKKLVEPYVNDVALTCTKITPVEICAPITVPEGHYYMMGDNRNASQDSRYWGFEPKERVVGRAVFRVWPWVPTMRFGPLD